MRARAVAVLVAAIMLAANVVLSDAARAQGNQSSAAGLETAPIGRVVTATGSVTIEHANAVVVQANIPVSSGVGQTKVGDPVYKGDVVQTGADGKLGITFTDGTAFNLSSNARMVLNEFVYEPNGKSNSTLFSLSKGTFTFVAGKVAKTGDMKIDTPVATMGIRGTTPYVEISDDGTVKFSTLIEENKNRVQENKGGAIEKRTDIDDNKRATKQRHATRASSRYTASARQAEEKNFDINFKICRGC
jgi:FecR protein